MRTDRPRKALVLWLAFAMLLPAGAFAREVWLDDLVAIDAPSNALVEELPAALDRIAEALAARTDSPSIHGETLAMDRAPRVVLLSALAGGRCHVVVGSGRGLERALDDAVRALPDAAREFTSLRLDLVISVVPAESSSDLRDRGLALRRGLGFARETELAVLVEELVADLATRSDGELVPSRLSRAIERRSAGRSPGNPARDELDPARLVPRWRFSTLAFLRSTRGKARGIPSTGQLDRDGPVSRTLRRDEVISAALAGADYLRRAVEESGRFAYSYRASEDETSDSYNMVRHAGTIYAMLETYRVQPDERLLAACDRAIGYLLSHTAPYPGREPGASYLAFRGKIKLGGVALAVLALVEHRRATGSDRHDAAIAGLANYIQRSQMADGRLLHQRAHPSLEPLPFRSVYYPGEAIFALVRAHAELSRVAWLDAAEKAALYLVEVRDRGIETAKLAPDHWLLYALEELTRVRPSETLLAHADRIATAIVGAQRLRTEFPEWTGTFYSPPRSTPVATRAEGLLAYRSLATHHERRELLPRVDRAIANAIRFQLSTQIDEARSFFLPRPERAFGGFSRGLENLEIRIDYVQHNVSALLALARWLDAEGRTSISLE